MWKKKSKLHIERVLLRSFPDALYMYHDEPPQKWPLLDHSVFSDIVFFVKYINRAVLTKAWIMGSTWLISDLMKAGTTRGWLSSQWPIDAWFHKSRVWQKNKKKQTNKLSNFDSLNITVTVLTLYRSDLGERRSIFDSLF